MGFTTDYNKARLDAEKQGRTLSVSDYRASLDAPSSTVSEPSPPPANIAGGTIRDRNRETSIAKSKLGLNEAEIAQLAENPAYQKMLFEMAYNPQERKGIQEYQQLTQAEAEREGLQGQLGDIRQNAPNAMLALEDALRTKVDVGQQALGESELFAKAGLEGYHVLGQSLNEQSRLMEDRYGSFINALSRAGQFQTNQYNALSNNYKILTDEYNQKAEEMNSILNQVAQYDRGLALAEDELRLKKEQLEWEDSLKSDNISAYGDVIPRGGFRTDRHNNPTAFTTAVAKQAGLVEGVDYVTGDAFPDNPNLFTAKLLGDPIETTIKVIDTIGFQTQSGQPRWTYINMDRTTWNGMSFEEKKNTIRGMYQKEGGSGEIFGEAQTTTSPSFYTPREGESEADFDRRLSRELLNNISQPGVNGFAELAKVAQAMGVTTDTVVDKYITPAFTVVVQSFPDMYQNPGKYPGLEAIQADYENYKQESGDAIEFDQYKVLRLVNDLHNAFGGIVPMERVIQILQGREKDFSQKEGGVNIFEELDVNLPGIGDESENAKLVEKLKTFQAYQASPLAGA